MTARATPTPTHLGLVWHLAQEALLSYDRHRGEIPKFPQDLCWRYSFGFILSTLVLTILFILGLPNKTTGFWGAAMVLPGLLALEPQESILCWLRIIRLQIETTVHSLTCAAHILRELCVSVVGGAMEVRGALVLRRSLSFMADSWSTVL